MLIRFRTASHWSTPERHARWPAAARKAKADAVVAPSYGHIRPRWLNHRMRAVGNVRWITSEQIQRHHTFSDQGSTSDVTISAKGTKKFPSDDDYRGSATDMGHYLSSVNEQGHLITSAYFVRSSSVLRDSLRASLRASLC